MEINLIEWLQYTIIIIVIGYPIYFLIPKIDRWFKVRTKSIIYNNAKNMSYGIYTLLEDKYKDTIAKMGDIKRREMEQILLSEYPTLTQNELNSINKEVCLYFNNINYEKINKNKLNG